MQMPSVHGNWESFSDWYTRRSRELGVPAATFAIVEQGDLRVLRHEGRASVAGDPSSIPLGCLTKVLTAHATLVLVARGKLSLTDEVIERLTDLDAHAVAVLKNVRVGHLLAHTSGVTDGLSTFAPPGEIYSYDKINYVLLGAVLDSVTERDWLETVTELVLQPLGLAPARLLGSEAAEPHRAAASQVVSMEVEDLCRYAALHLDPGSDTELAAVASLMRSSRAWHPRTGDTDVNGFAFKHNSSGNYGHIGLSHAGRIDLMISPGRGVCAVHSTQGQDAQLCGEVLGGKLGLWAIGQTLKAAMRQPAPTSAEGYAGTYRHGDVEITVSSERGALWYRCSSDEANPIRLQKVAPRLCVVPGKAPPVYIEFVGGARVEAFGFIRVGESIYERRSP